MFLLRERDRGPTYKRPAPPSCAGQGRLHRGGRRRSGRRERRPDGYTPLQPAREAPRLAALLQPPPPQVKPDSDEGGDNDDDNNEDRRPGPPASDPWQRCVAAVQVARCRGLLQLQLHIALGARDLEARCPADLALAFRGGLGGILDDSAQIGSGRGRRLVFGEARVDVGRRAFLVGRHALAGVRRDAKWRGAKCVWGGGR